MSMQKVSQQEAAVAAAHLLRLMRHPHSNDTAWLQQVF